MQLSDSLVSFIKNRPNIWNKIQYVRALRKRVGELSFYFYDIGNTFKSMNWPQQHSSLDTLSAELVFQYHKLEKGLVMPGPRRMFGIKPATATMRLLDNWQSIHKGPITDPIFLAGVGTLQSYSDHIKKYKLDINDEISSIVEHFIAQHTDQRETYPTPSAKKQYYNPEEFFALASSRRSVRQFLDKPVPKDIILASYRAGQQAPSACNRQPCSVKIVRNSALKKEVLKYQNGNAGFGHLVPAVAIITANEKYFYGGIERHQPYIDGGLFSMSFILGLQSHGVSSCCLNWCVTPKTDKAVHSLLKLDSSERIIMYLAIGYATDDIMVATSTRRTPETTLCFVDKD